MLDARSYNNNTSQILCGQIMSSLVSMLCLLLFGTTLSVAQFAAVEGLANSLSTLPYDGLESQVLASDSIIGDNQFLPPPSGDSPGTLTIQIVVNASPLQISIPLESDQSVIGAQTHLLILILRRRDKKQGLPAKPIAVLMPIAILRLTARSTKILKSSHGGRNL